MLSGIRRHKYILNDLYQQVIDISRPLWIIHPRLQSNILSIIANISCIDEIGTIEFGI